MPREDPLISFAFFSFVNHIREANGRSNHLEQASVELREGSWIFGHQGQQGVFQHTPPISAIGAGFGIA